MIRAMIRGSFAAVAILSAFSVLPSPASAETIVAQRLQATRRLIPLKKITVGPDDQYQGVVDPSGQSLVFTRKSDLVPHLQRQNLKTGEVIDLVPLTADSHEPAIGPDGRLAFTFYRFNARGDICHFAMVHDRAVSDSDITCLKRPQEESQTERASPFWRAPGQLGYVVRDISGQSARIVVENLETGARETLAERTIWSPAMRPGGKYLAYSELVGGEERASRALMIKDLSTGQARAIRFSLPGMSGFPAFSEDERYLYFSHYLDDTNHDRVIDGSDNSVVFRARLDELLALKEGEEHFPEQLTSVATNCSFPRPQGDAVYVSCAFEGALDVYRIPATGVVPTDWDRKIVDNAHQTSRSYADRVLLLNTMRYRFKATGTAERLLGNHLLADDTTAARYYVRRLERQAPGPALRDFYALVGLYVDARDLKKAQPSREISREFLRQISAIEAKAQALGSQPRLQKIVRGHLRAFVEQSQEAGAWLAQVKFDSRALPLERYLAFELAHWTLPRTRSDEALAAAMTDAYRAMMSAPELSHESRVYYAFNWLASLEKSEEQGDGDAKARARRITRISKLVDGDSGLPPAVASLLRSESAVLRIVQSPDEASKSKTYSELDRFMSESRGDYFLRKALYVRAVLNFTAAGEFKYMGFVATNWLRYTASGDTEFIHAREFYAESQLDRAYDAWGKRKAALAGAFFFGSLSLTDDLESHAGYVRTSVLQGVRANIEKDYANLKSRQQIDDNLNYVEALLTLIDAEPAALKDPSMVKHLDRAIDKLKAMEQDRDSPVRYLLLGYCHLEKLRRTASGLEIDPDLFQSAHRDLMLAHDLGRDNARVRAAVLDNLGILHQRAQNHGLAARFFALRKPLGFVSSAEAGSFAWLYARSLYHAHEADRAADELASVPGDVPQAFVAPLLEREAFYRVAAGQYERAAKIYGKILDKSYGHPIEGDLSLAKVKLSYGFALFKNGRVRDAQPVLKAALAHAERLKPVSRGRERLIDFEPVRIQLIAHGLLSRMGTDADRLAAIEKRAALLPQAEKHFGEEGYLPIVIENRLTWAALADRAQPGMAAGKMKEALELAEKFGGQDQWLSAAVYRTAAAYLAHGWLHSPLYSKGESERVRKIVDQCVHAYDTQGAGSAQLAYQKLKLQLLKAGFDARVGGVGAAAGQLRAILEVDGGKAIRSVREQMPAQAEELEKLATALARG